MKDRIESIDLLRGLAMAIMALDHVRDYFHLTANTDDPLNLNTTTMALFYDGLPILRTGFCISFRDVHLSAIPQEDEKGIKFVSY